MNYAQPVLTVELYDECVRFYRDVMGCQVVSGGEGAPLTAFASGGSRFSLLDASRRPPEMPHADARIGGAPRLTLAFLSDDVDADHRQLCQAGVSFFIDPMDSLEWGVRAALCRDPDGNPIEIFQPLG